MSQGDFIDAAMLQELEAALVQQIEFKARNSPNSNSSNSSTKETHKDKTDSDKTYEDWQRKCK